MKVLQINCSCTFGSTGRIVEDLSTLMCEEGIENLILYSGNRISKFPAAIAVNTKLDIRIHQILSRLSGDQGWHSICTTRKMISQIRSFDPDIIHLHNLHGYYLNLPILFEFLSSIDVPVIWTLHDCWAFTGHCAHYSDAKCYKWKTDCANCPQKKSYPYSWFFDRSHTLFSVKKKLYRQLSALTVTTVSNWLLNEVSQSPLLNSRRIISIPNGIDLSVFKPGKKLTRINTIDISQKKVLLGIANSWSERKGLRDFIHLSSFLPDDWIIVLVGLSKKQQATIPPNIIGIGRTDNVEQLIDLYTTAHAYFCASTEETFGLTILESIACGTPAIVYNSTACPEMITPQIGFVVEPHDLQGVLNCLLTISNCAKEKYELACINEAHTYEKKMIYNKYLALYKSEVARYGKGKKSVL